MNALLSGNKKMITKKEEVKKTNNKELKNLEGYIKDFWKFLPIPVCFVNPFNTILNITGKFEKFSGYKETEIIGENLSIVFPAQGFILEVLADTRENDVVDKKEAIFITKDKKEIYVTISTSQRKDEEDSFSGYFLSISDVSESKTFQKKLEEEVKVKTEELQKKVLELEKFQKFSVGREVKMRELKKKIGRLEERSGIASSE